MGKRVGKFGWVASVIALAVLVSGIAHASQFLAFGRDAQVRTSNLIALGRVVSMRSEWNDQRSGIYTDTEIALDEVWKGDPASDRVVVRTLGGRVGTVALEVDGAATFGTGERVLVFLRSEAGTFTPWGMRFGKYEVIDQGGSTFVVGTLPPTVSGAQHYPQVSFLLDELRAEVTSLVAAEAK